MDDTNDENFRAPDAKNNTVRIDEDISINKFSLRLL